MPRREQATGDRAGVLGRTRRGRRRSGPTRRPSRAGHRRTRRARSASPRSGRRSRAAAWRSLCRAAASAAGSPRRAAPRAARRRARVARGVGVQQVEVRGRPPASTGPRRRDDHPPPGAVVGDRRDHLAAPGAEGGAADQRERHVATRAARPARAGRRRRCPGPTAGRAPPGRRPRRPSRRPCRRRPGSPCRSRGPPLRSRPWWAAERLAGAEDDVVSSSGTVVSVDVRRGVDPTASAGRRRDVVVQPDRLVDGHQRVEAVRPRGTDAEVEVDLAGGADRVPQRHAVQLLGDPDELGDAERLAAGQRVDAGRDQRRLGGLTRAGDPAEHAAQRLAALGERGVDDGEHLLPGDVRARRGRAASTRPGRSRRWAPARRRCGRSRRRGGRRRTRRP